MNGKGEAEREHDVYHTRDEVCSLVNAVNMNETSPPIGLLIELWAN